LQQVTHPKSEFFRILLEPPAESMRLARNSAAPLAEKLAALLWQLPANLPKDMRKLENFAAMLDSWPEVRHVSNSATSHGSTTKLRA
jgi:uncharacterized protein YecE (DUF72 family)